MVLVTRYDCEKFANDNMIPLLFIFDETRLVDNDNFPTFICFQRDYEKVQAVTPISFIINAIPDQLENNQARLQIEYDKKESE